MWRRRENLAAYTTFRIGGPADWFAEPETEEECLNVWHQARRIGARLHVLGGGSNLLIDDEGVRGAVIATRRLSPRRIERRGRRVRASAAVPLARLVHWAARSGLAGLEHLAGIPGLVGGAVVMNAGGRRGTLGERVSAVHALDPTGRCVRLSAARVRWGYRATSLPGWLVLSAEFDLRRASPAAVGRRTRDALAEKRSAQPLSAWSAGCVFRNPEADAAGRLIDAAGLKGARCGDAEVSPQHANFIVNRGRATARDVRALVERIRRRVRARFRRELEMEIHCWPQIDPGEV